jgi:hypothetical protein
VTLLGAGVPTPDPASVRLRLSGSDRGQDGAATYSHVSDQMRDESCRQGGTHNRMSSSGTRATFWFR